MHSGGGSQGKAVQLVSSCQLTTQHGRSPPGGWATLAKETHGKKSKASEHQADVQPHNSFQPRKS